MGKTKSAWLMALLLLCLLQPIATLAVAGKPEKLSTVIRQSLEKTFPGSKITSTEKEKWKGETVNEVELITPDGVRYEVFISDEGVIQKIEEDDDWKWFSK